MHKYTLIDGTGWSLQQRLLMKGPTEITFFDSVEAAKGLGFDLWSYHWIQLQKMPFDESRWFQAMAMCDDEHISEVLRFAELHLRLDLIATGTDNGQMFCPRLACSKCLDIILQELHRFPGRGRPLITTGLKSPTMSNRICAVAALAAMPREQWPNGLNDSLRLAAILEPNEILKKEMRMVLSGRTSDERHRL